MDGAPAVTSLINAHGSRDVIMKKMQEVTSRRQALQILSGGAFTIAFSSVHSGGAFAQEYPTKPVKLIVPYAAGGTTDVGARILGMQLEKYFGKGFVVENKPGASARLGAAFVVQSPPDGYTLIWTVADPFAIIPHIFKDVPYDALKDIVPVAMVGSTPMSLVINPKVPANSLAEFIKLAKAKPGSLTYGSWGVGSGAHIRTEAFKAAADVDLLHVPFQGSGPAFNALLGGHIDVMIVGAGLAAESHNAGKVKMLAVDTKERYPDVPGVPTFAEQGLPLDLTFWNGVLAPAKTPVPVLEMLNKAINQVIREPEFQKAATAAGLVVNAAGTGGTGVSLNEVKIFYDAEYKRWSDVIRKANISVE